MAPDGRTGHYIECPHDIAECMDRAASLCPQGYDVIDSGGQHGAIAQTSHEPYASNTVVSPTFRGNMTIACRAPMPQGPPPQPPPQACAFPNGAYSIRYSQRSGSCGNLDETVLAFHPNDKWGVPTGCTGDVRLSPDACEVTLDYTCQSAANVPPGKIVQVAHWNYDGTEAHGTRQITIGVGQPTPLCTGVYDITIKRL
jgi:hypothetical protein